MRPRRWLPLIAEFIDDLVRLAPGFPRAHPAWCDARFMKLSAIWREPQSRIRSKLGGRRQPDTMPPMDEIPPHADPDADREATLGER
jgi:hypothetical protein